MIVIKNSELKKIIYEIISKLNVTVRYNNNTELNESAPLILYEIDTLENSRAIYRTREISSLYAITFIFIATDSDECDLIYDNLCDLLALHGLYMSKYENQNRIENTNLCKSKSRMIVDYNNISNRLITI